MGGLVRWVFRERHICKSSFPKPILNFQIGVWILEIADFGFRFQKIDVRILDFENLNFIFIFRISFFSNRISKVGFWFSNRISKVDVWFLVPENFVFRIRVSFWENQISKTYFSFFGFGENILHFFFGFRF